MDSSPEPSLIVFCWGNQSRGDDGIGPAVAARLRALGRGELRLIEDHQLNIEHVMDFHGMTPLLFVDASVAIDAGCRLERLAPSEEGNFSTHAISPGALLNVYGQSTGEPAPPAYLLHVAGRDFELGAGLGDTARTALDEAFGILRRVLVDDPSDWPARLERAARGDGPA
ncbi:MAG: hydrogenase maturation protease [Proteobacteria bacterium]|nr:hydrogenase maturation protease [Pseudomonadota bacterium]